MKILIATGIYPPDIGGPAQYAKNLYDTWSKAGHIVSVKAYRLEKKLPTGIRHLLYLLRIIPKVINSDFIIALDTFSVGLPVLIACKIFRKKYVIRTGGDFLWESYVERTGDLVLFRNFYDTRLNRLTSKERMIFGVTKCVLGGASKVIFSTEWQRDIFTNAYGLDKARNVIVENYYGEKCKAEEPSAKNYLAGSRKLKWKNLKKLADIFQDRRLSDAGISCDNEQSDYLEYMERMSKCYAVLLISLGDISPNMILDAIRYNKPFIVTRENGLMSRIKDIAITVDPENSEDIIQKILWLSNEENYRKQIEKLQNFKFTHSWEDIGRELLGSAPQNIYKTK